MDTLYDLCASGAPLKDIAEAAAGLLGSPVGLYANDGAALCHSEGFLLDSEKSLSLPLIWQMDTVGSIVSKTRKGINTELFSQIAHAVACAVSVRIILRDLDERALWEACRGNVPSPVSNSCATTRCCYLLTADTSSFSEEQRTAFYLRMARIHPFYAAAFNEKTVFGFVRMSFEERRSTLSSYEALLREFDCDGTISQPFAGPGELFHQIEFARLTLLVGRKLDVRHSVHLYRTEQFGSFLLFLTMQKTTSLYPYYCDEVIRIMEYDCEKGTEFSKSLYVYLDSFMDLKNASQEVFVHRNTLGYHLKKIEALLGQKFPTETLRFEMMCTYRMLGVADTL